MVTSNGDRVEVVPGPATAEGFSAEVVAALSTPDSLGPPAMSFAWCRRYVPVTPPDPPVSAYDRERPMSDVRTADEAAIRDVLEDSYRAWAAGDADGMVAAYTGDASAIMPGALRDSREVIRGQHGGCVRGPARRAPRRSTSS